ncbi:MAG: hypothetical protein RR620_08590 [Clostridium sp.]
MMNNLFNNVEFDVETMKRLIQSDMFLRFSFQDLMRRNPTNSEISILEVIFNSYVLEDSIMIDEYLSHR